MTPKEREIMAAATEQARKALLDHLLDYLLAPARRVLTDDEMQAAAFAQMSKEEELSEAAREHYALISGMFLQRANGVKEPEATCKSGMRMWLRGGSIMVQPLGYVKHITVGVGFVNPAVGSIK